MDIRDVVIRKCTKLDAKELADFYNKSKYGPITSGHSLKESDMVKMFKIMNIVLYLCLEYEKKIIGTMLFSTVSGQKASKAKSVWGGKFLIAPEYRLVGSLPSMLFTESIKQLTDLGYHYIDVEVDPKNKSAFPLYKRVGFIRSTRSYVDYDGYVELRTYLPMIISFLKEGYGVEMVRDDMMDEGWRGLNKSDLRSIGKDTIDQYGMELVPYQMEIGEDIISCLVDIRTEKVALMEDPRFKFTSYVKEGQKLIVGQEANLVFEYENRLDQTVLVSFQTSFLGEKLTYKNGKRRVLLQSGKSIEWTEKVHVESPAEGSLRTTLKFGKVKFTFEYGVEAQKEMEISIRKNHFYQNRNNTLPVIVQNNSTTLKKGSLSILAKELDSQGLKMEYELILSPGEKKVVPVHFFTTSTGMIVCDISFKERDKHFDILESFELVISPKSEIIRYFTEEKVILENLFIRLELNRATGGMEVYENLSGKKVVEEAWPDSSYPFKSSIKRMLDRTIEVIFLEEKTNLLAIERKGDHINVIRRIILGNEGLIEVNDYVINGNLIKIYPWSSLRGATATIPMKKGLIQRQIIEEVSPLGIHDYEFVENMEMPSDPDEYEASWSSFENEHMTVGLIWHSKGKVDDVTFGLNWMPSIVFKAEKDLQKMQQVYDLYNPLSASRIEKLPNRRSTKLQQWLETEVADATHYYKIGQGGYKEVKHYWQVLVGELGKPETLLDVVTIDITPQVVYREVDTIISGKIATELLRTVKGKCEIEIPDLSYYEEKDVVVTNNNPVPFEIPVNTNTVKSIIKGYLRFSHTDTGERIKKEFPLLIQNQATGVEMSEKKKRGNHLYELDNEKFVIAVSPEYQGSIVSMRYEKKNVLISNFPSLKKPWGDNIIAPAGIYPHFLKEPITVDIGTLFEEKYLTEFTSQAYSENGWSGISLHSSEYDISYLTKPGLPLLKLKTVIQCGENGIDGHMVLHTVWNKIGNGRKIYYWGAGRRKVYDETGKRGKFYIKNPKVVIHLGKDYYISIWSENPHSEIAVYEWPDKGIELLLITDSCQEEGIYYVACSRTLQEAEQYLSIEMRYFS